MSRFEAADSNIADDILRYAIAIGATLVLLLPAARGSHEALGWLPLWLLAMPLSGWLALRWSRRAVAPEVVPRSEAIPARRRRIGPQARRRPLPASRSALPRAA